MYKRIMTVDELYLFCLKNNFSTFDSKVYGSELVVQMPGNFKKSEDYTNRLTEGLVPFVSRAFHDKVNLNKSQIKEDVFIENVPSSAFRPILAHVITNEETNEKDFGAHDFYIEVDEDGNEKFVYEEQPVGVIDGSRTSIEYDEEQDVNRAVLHGYLYSGYCQDAIDILERRGTVSCSVELVIREMSFDAKNKTLILDDFYVSGLSLLGEKVKPGMAGSDFKIEDFSIKTGSLKFNVENKLIEMLESIKNIEEKLSGFNINNQSNIGKNQFDADMDESFYRKEEESLVGNINLNEKNVEEVVEETIEVVEMMESSEETIIEKSFEEKSEDDESEETPDVDDEETDDSDDGEEKVVEEESEENFEENSTEESTEIFTEKGNMVRTYEISLEDIRSALYGLLSLQEEADQDYYWIEATYSDYFIYQSYRSGNYYKQSYSINGDEVTFDGNRIEVFCEFLTAEEKEELSDMRSNYSSIVNELNVYKSAELYADKMTVFEDVNYQQFLEADGFKELMSKETVDKYSKEELQDKAELLFAKLVKAKGTFTANTDIEEKPAVKKTSMFTAFSARTENSSFLDKLLNQ